LTFVELSIIRQKSYKVDQDLEASEANVREINFEIHKFTKKIGILNEKVFVKQQEHHAEETNCEQEHAELLEKLRVSNITFST